MRTRLNFRVPVFEIVRADGFVQYRGPKDGAEFTMRMQECRNSTLREVKRPSRKLQQACFNASNVSFYNR
jgi:hypothetical protein